MPRDLSLIQDLVSAYAARPRILMIVRSTRLLVLEGERGQWDFPSLASLGYEGVCVSV